MSNTVTVKESEDGSLYLDIMDFEDFIDTDKVAYYALKIKDGAAVIKFYNKKRKLIKTKIKDGK